MMKAYIEQLRKRASRCRFGTFEDKGEACNNQLVLLVLGISLRKRLLQEDELSFEKATRIALQFETVESQGRISSVLRTSNIRAIEASTSSSNSILTRTSANVENTRTNIIQCTNINKQVLSIW